jgi:predicted transcriptional regulator
MAMNEQGTNSSLVDLAAEIVSAYVSNNSVRPSELPNRAMHLTQVRQLVDSWRAAGLAEFACQGGG